MLKGRPKLPEGERMVIVSLRLPQDLVEWYDADPNHCRSAVIRRALESYMREYQAST